MAGFLFRRLIATLPVLIGVCTITFFLLHFVPGDPIDIMLGDQASAFDKESMRKEMGLDRPIMEQYGSFMLGVATFDLGTSLHQRKPVAQLIGERFWATFELTIAAFILTILIGVPLGILAAVYKGSWVDTSALTVGLLGMSIPNFWLGPVLIYIFAMQLDLLPVSERGSLAHLVLPALSLATALASIVVRMTRSSMLEVINEDYVRTARAKGLTDRAVYAKHAFRNALMPVVTNLGLQLGALLTGAVITETIFDWPGLGTLLLEAINTRDYPLVQGCLLFVASVYVFVNLLTDIVYGIVNPRVRLE